MENAELKYVIRPSRLSGQVKLSGAKNSSLRLLAASLLTAGEITLSNFPEGLLDAKVHLDMLEKLGKRCGLEGDTVCISEDMVPGHELVWEGRSIRNTLLVLGALLARTGAGSVPLPGGCKIGTRKYDLHELVFTTLGAEVWTEGDNLCAKVEDRLKGGDIHLPIRSTGATENAIICGSLCRGVTRVWNPHIRPEIMDLIEFMNKMGARIRVFGQEHIEITGVEELSGTSHRIVPDNVEGLTWLAASAISGGDVEIIDFPVRHLEIPLVQMRESGINYYSGPDSIIVRGGSCYPFEISTGPYPGINSDMQPVFAACGYNAKGVSRIWDLRFEDRFKYAGEVAKMGGAAEQDGRLLTILGGRPLKGTDVEATDIRAGIALVLVALAAEGETRISKAWQIERGYDRFIEKLSALGGDCERI